MNNYLLLSALRARYRILLLILGITVLVTAIVSVLLPKTYIATAAMLVDNKADQSMSGATDTHVRERIGYMQTQVDIITSQKVARKVVADLELTTRPEARVALEEAFERNDAVEDRLAESLLKRLKVDTSQSSVINIAFPSSDPRFSALIANAFAKAYMDTALELRVEPSRQTAEWFDEQIKNLRNNLEQALARLTDYQKEKGIVTLDERMDADSFATGTLAQSRVYGNARTQQSLVRPATASGYDEFALSHSQRVRADLARAEAKRQELGTRLGENHPAYQRQLAVIQTLRTELSRSTDQTLLQNQRREAELHAASMAQQARVSELRQYRNQVAVLTRDVDISQKAYETALQRSLDKKVESRASLTNVSILNAAAVPFKAARPRISLNIALAAVVGTLLGLCAIYLMELFDRRVRSVVDLANEWNVPLLAELRASQPTQDRLLPGPGTAHILPSPG